MSKLKPIEEIHKSGINLERVLLKYSHGYITFGFYKDGMVQIDNKWYIPENTFESFMTLTDLKKLLKEA
jgi:hypothetical protein